LKPARKRELVDDLCCRYGVSIRQACEAMMISRSMYHYRSVAADQAPLRHRIKEIAAARVRYGYKRIHVVLRREGWRINHKRVYRLYKQAGLSLFERRPRRHRTASHRPQPATTRINESWSMDFVSDQLYDGRQLRALTLIDVHTRECLAIWVDQGIRGEDVVRTLSAVVVSRGKPDRIQVDNGPEFVSKALDRWAYGTMSSLPSRGRANRPTMRTSKRSTVVFGRST